MDLLKNGIAVARIAALLLSFPAWGQPLAASSLASPDVAAKKALVVGINQYQTGPPEASRRPYLLNLSGAVNDARAIADLLSARGYEVQMLLDAQATREAILAAIASHLESAARPGADLVFYFAGHGSQVATSDPWEPDGLAETLVPADAAAGTPDLRDDQLRAHLWPLLERGARLTLVLDACHSGSLREIPTGARSRFAEPSPIPAGPSGTRPLPPLTDGDALILAAAQADQSAFENGDGSHGVFSHALLQVLGSAGSNETAAETLRRIQGLLMARGKDQRPVIAGSTARHSQPLFASPAAGPDARSGDPKAVVIAANGREIELEGGSALGFRSGDRLFREGAWIVLEKVGPVRSTGFLEHGSEVQTGQLFTRQRRGRSALPDLTLLVPESRLSASQLLDLAKLLEIRLRQHGHWSADPEREIPTHTLRFERERWLLVSRRGEIAPQGDLDGPAIEKLAKTLPTGSKVLLQLPLPAGGAAQLGLGPDSALAAIATVDGLDGNPDYLLIGRRDGEHLVFRFSRGIVAAEPHRAQLPIETREVRYPPRDEFGEDLAQLARRLAGYRFWMTLEGAPEDLPPYRLALRNPASGGTIGPLEGSGDNDAQLPRIQVGEKLGFALVGPRNISELQQRYLYVMMLAADGSRKLLYPNNQARGENRLPKEHRELERTGILPFGNQPEIRITEPLGRETYLLLSTTEPLSDPSVLDEEGVRTARPDDDPLVRWFLSLGSGQRSGAMAAPVSWSVDRLTVEVVAAGPAS